MLKGIGCFLALVAVCAGSVEAWAEVIIDTVTVGNPGNAPDTRYVPDGIGQVDYVYEIGKHEITAGQYAAFLNAVAQSDPYGLYHTSMFTFQYGCHIERTGVAGGYSYSVASDWANRPVNYVSWGDAARFCNWMHNGQPSGPQDAATTEAGSYELHGATTDSELMAVQRELHATWVIPSADEWYKAAYHRDNGTSGDYWDYPTQSDAAPGNQALDPDPGNNANYLSSDGGYAIGAPYYRTEAGAFENSQSPYGTFDQAGNVAEWNEIILGDGTSRGLWGGSWNYFGDGMHASERDHQLPPSSEYIGFGFRVSEVPEPATMVMLALAGLGIVRRR